MTESNSPAGAPAAPPAPPRVRTAQCQCGGLSVRCEGPAARISLCHCLACQRRTGSVFSANSRFDRARVTVSGPATAWVRTADSGHPVTAWFCPTCGSTVYWELGGFPDVIAVAQGMFADPAYPAPTVAVWEDTRHPWTDHIADLPLQRHEKAP